MQKKYDIIYSLGSDCACAMYMNKFFLRNTSGPFDWLTHAPFETRINLILDDFVGFLDQKDMRFLPKNPNVFNDKNCDYYENTRNGFYFYHDFSIGKPFLETYPGVREKYDRRIARFYDNIEKHNRVLLIWYSQTYKTPNDILISLCNRVCKKFNKQIDFIIIEHDENMPRGTIKSECVSNNIMRFWAYAIDDTTQTMGNIKLIGRIFSKIRLRGMVLTKIYTHIIKLIARIACMFIPSRHARHNFRKTISKWARI